MNPPAISKSTWLKITLDAIQTAQTKHVAQENHTQVSKLVSFTSGREDMEKTLQSSVNPADLSDGEEPSGLPPVPPPPLENEGACSPSLDLCTVKYSLFERKVKGIT